MSAAQLKLEIDLHDPRVRSSRARPYILLALVELRDGDRDLAQALLRRARELACSNRTPRRPNLGDLRLVEPPVLRMTPDARTIVMPDGTAHDFSRRGPLRLMMLALGEAAARGDDCLSVQDLMTVGYPDETVTVTSGRMRVHTSVRRLRNLGFADVLLTRDEGYLLDPKIRVELDDFTKV